MNLYAIDYIRRALTLDNLEPPDRSRARSEYNNLEDIYNAHQMAAGTEMAAFEAARVGWRTVARNNPQLAAAYETQKDLYTAEQLDQIPEMSYKLDGYPIYAGGMNVLFGMSGAGKSFVALDIALTIARTENVIYIAAEGVGTYQGRVNAWYAWHGERKSNRAMFYGRAVDTGNLEAFRAFTDHIVKPMRPQIIVIDTVARCMPTMDENNTNDMKRFVDTWAKLQHEMGVTLLFVHHVGKSGTMRGSLVLRDAADSVMSLMREDGVIGIYNDDNRGGKNKGAECHKPIYFKITQVPLPGQTEEDKPPAVMERVERKNVDLSEVGNLSENQLEILNALYGLEDDGLSSNELETILKGKMSKSTVYYQCSKLRQAGYIQRTAGMNKLTEKGNKAVDSNGGAGND